MSVRPVRVAADGGVEVRHDEAGHGGVVAVADVRFGRDPGGGVDPDWLELPCPVPGCGAVSYHPVGGGAHPAPVQALFLRTVLRRAAALGVPVGQRSFAAIKARVRARVLAADGDPDRWRLEAMQAEDDAAPGEAED